MDLLFGLISDNFNFFMLRFNAHSACKLTFLHNKIEDAFYWIQVTEENWTDLSWSLKHDEHGDISVPSGENQEIDTDLMSSHATMKTTRNTTQNAFRQLRHVLSGTGPEMTSNKAYQALSLTHSHKAAAS